MISAKPRPKKTKNKKIGLVSCKLTHPKAFVVLVYDFVNFLIKMESLSQFRELVFIRLISSS